MKNSLKLFFLIFIFLIFSTYSIKDNTKKFSTFFPIKKILIENNLATSSYKLKSDLDILINTSLFFLNKKEILSIINKHEFIFNVQLKKKYPNTLKILLIEKIPLATQIIDKKKFYITEKNQRINFIDIQIYDDLPLIIGEYKNFNIFYNDLKKNNFKISEIKFLYYFDIGRWNIVLKDDKIIKFPINYLDLLPKINLTIDNSNFSNYKVFDFRIKDQLILQ